MKLNITNEEYHLRPEISNSDIKELLKSPYHYKNKDLFREEKDCFKQGGAFDTLVLQPELFNDKYAVMEDMDFRTKKAKEYKANFINENKNKTILEAEKFEEVKKWKNSLLNDDYAKNLLRNGEAEQSYFSELEGVQVRCRPDYYREDIGAIIDIKTTINASPESFQNTIANLSYDTQASFYSDILRNEGYKVNTFTFLVVEKKAPYVVAYYDLDIPSMDKARELYIKALNDYKYCKENNHWFGYGDFDRVNKKYNPVKTLTTPAWRHYK